MKRRTWEQEKERIAKKAKELGAEMDRAIETADMDRFRITYEKAFNYMTVKERSRYYRRFLARITGRA